MAALLDEAGVGDALEAAKGEELELNSLTVEEVAERTDLNPGTVVRAEQGKNPTLLTLTRLLRCYGALGGMEALVPEPTVSPVAEARARRGEAGG